MSTIDGQDFKNWFGNSKIVDAAGIPLRLYHGTEAQKIDVFDRDRVGEQFHQDERGFFFTDSETEAEGYARNTSYGLPRETPGAVVSVYLSLQNPLIVEIDMDPVNEWDNNHAEIQRKATEGGHDGIVVKAKKYSSMYVAFDPAQIMILEQRPAARFEAIPRRP